MSISVSNSDYSIIKEMGERTIIAINNLDKSTTYLNKIMIWLTVSLVGLNIVLIWLTYKIVFPH